MVLIGQHNLCCDVVYVRHVMSRAPFLAEARDPELKKRVEVETPDLLSCSDDTLFWISFGNVDASGSIVIGQGVTSRTIYVISK